MSAAPNEKPTPNIGAEGNKSARKRVAVWTSRVEPEQYRWADVTGVWAHPRNLFMSASLIYGSDGKLGGGRLTLTTAARAPRPPSIRGLVNHTTMLRT